MAMSKGKSVSFNNTPQAADDFFSAAIDGFTEDNLTGRTILLDVMANDAGGNAKSLYSLDDAINSAGTSGDLLQRDAVGSANRSLHGATIKITADGKVSYDAGTLDASFAADLQHLGAGQFANDSFTYAIQLGNGTLSWASATVQVSGVNDAPVIVSSTANAAVVEMVNTSASADADLAAGGINFTDLDFTDRHTASAVANANGYLGTFWLDPIAQDSGNGATGSIGWHFSVADGALDFLAAGQQLTQSYTVTVDDGHGGTAQQTVNITLTGSNDAPVITTSAQTGAVSELSATAGSAVADTAGGSITFTDLDLTDTHSATIVANGNGYLGSLTLAPVTQDSAGGGTGSVGWHFSVADGALDFLAAGQQLTQSYTVTVDDGHNGTAQQTVKITLTGSNDRPILETPVAGDPVLANDSLTITDALAFSDLDLSDTHTVMFTPQGSGYVGDFQPVITADANGHGSITATYHLTKAQVEANGGNFPDHQDYLVTIDDHHGGTSSQTVSIPLGQILSNVGGDGGDGGGGNTGPNHAPIITYSSADQFPAFVWDDPTATTLNFTGLIDFSDPDPHDVHHLQVFAAPSNWGHLMPTFLDTANGGNGQIQWSYSVDESLVRPLGGESHQDQFLFRITDSSGAFVDQAVRVWDFGRDEAPIIQGPGNLVLDLSAGGGPINVSGHFFFNDADISDTHSLGSHPGPDGLGGVFTFSLVRDTTQGVGGEVHWTYTLDPSGFQYLGAGDSVSTGWPITVSGNNDAAIANGFPVNGPGMSTTENITFIVHGVNDDPHFNTSPVTITDSPWIGSDFGVHRADNIGFGDVDNNDSHFVFALFDANASTEPQIGYFAVEQQGDTTGGSNANAVIHWTYDASAADIGTHTAPIHQVYDIVLNDNHGGQATQQFTIDLFPHV